LLAHIFSGMPDSGCHDEVHMARACQRHENDNRWSRSTGAHRMQPVWMPQLYELYP
jgi:hypothetical protein